ncbi:hypothetical protein SEA_AIKOY__25 [Mycobacterium phage Aikoy]|uniref:Scaffolding protein n=1 Tax=Mycobacterium phage Onyinye TaxID=2686235 RepID=A0A6B9L6X3_9CAUD|nr:head scaffolding protein [Mycobacterium phage Onyinye]QHB37432.1 hypothetical protein SEA_ONYINYE_26 [Mycobacterium phage Onyinye]WKW85187.1 hypothetical protein SEA_AIKOY__25 [Mycobacterium phage Aikoy]
MSQSPVRPYSRTTHEGKLRLRFGDGEGEQDPSGEPQLGEPQLEETPEAKAAREAQEKMEQAEQKRKEAEKRAADAEKKLQEKDREGLEEHELLAADHEDLKARYDKLLKFVETSALDSSILRISSAKTKDGQSKYEWYDVEAVRAFIDMDAIKLDLDTGEVEGLDRQLAEIAKKRPYLLVQPKEAPQGGGSFTPPPGPATGSQPFGGSSRQRETDSKKLAKKFKFDHLVVGGSPR